MMQDEAMSMSNEQAIQILKPMRDMMRDQHGCPISDAYFAVDKAIHALQTISPDEVRGVGCAYCKEDRDGYTMPLEKNAHAWVQYPNKLVVHLGGHLRKCEIKYCPMCGRRLEVSEDA